MRVHKTILFSIGAVCILSILAVVTYFVLTFNPRIEEVHCTSFSKIYYNKDCGYITNFSNKDINKIDGIIKNKHEVGNYYVIDLITYNSLGKEIILPVYIATDPLPKYLSLVTPFEQIAKGKEVSRTEVLKTAKNLYSLLNKGDEVIVNM